MTITGKKVREKIKVEENIRKKTYSTIFLLPALGVTKETWDKFGFVNCYLSDKGHDVFYKNALHILLEPEFNEEFKLFVEEQSKRDVFLEDYDCGPGQVIIVYRFPPEYLKEYKNFIKGKYSKFSKKYVSSFFPMTKKEYKNGNSRTVSTVFAGIFNKESWLKEYWEKKLEVDILPDEYWSIPDESKEIFRYDNKK